MSLSGKGRRAKGAAAEREVSALFRANGFPEAERTKFTDGLHVTSDLKRVEGLSVEVKRQERLSLPAALRQASEQADEGEVPVVVHRSNHQPWIISMPLEDWFAMRATQSAEPSASSS